MKARKANVAFRFINVARIRVFWLKKEHKVDYVDEMMAYNLSA